MEQRRQSGTPQTPGSEETHEQQTPGAGPTMDEANIIDLSEANTESGDTGQRIPSVNPHDRPPESDPCTVRLILHTERVVPSSSPIDVDNLEDEDRNSEADEGDGDGANDNAEVGDVDEENLDESDRDDADQLYSESGLRESDAQKSLKVGDNAGDSDVDDDEDTREGENDDDIDMQEVVGSDEEAVAGDDDDPDTEREAFEDDDMVTDDVVNAGASMGVDAGLVENEADVVTENVTVIVETNNFSLDDSLPSQEINNSDKTVEDTEYDSNAEELGDSGDILGGDSDNAAENDESVNPDSPESSSAPEANTDMAQIEGISSTGSVSQHEARDPDAKDDAVSIDDDEKEFEEDHDGEEGHESDESDIEHSVPDEGNHDSLPEQPESVNNKHATDVEVAPVTGVHATVVASSRAKEGIDNQLPPKSTQALIPRTNDAANQSGVVSSSATIQELNGTTQKTGQNVSSLEQDGALRTGEKIYPLQTLPLPKESGAANSSTAIAPASTDPETERVPTATVDPPEKVKDVTVKERGENCQSSSGEGDSCSSNCLATEANNLEASELPAQSPQSASPSTTNKSVGMASSELSYPTPDLTSADGNSDPSQIASKPKPVESDVKFQHIMSPMGDSADHTVDTKDNDTIAVDMPDTVVSPHGEIDEISNAKKGLIQSSQTATVSHRTPTSNNLGGGSGAEDLKIEPGMKETTGPSSAVESTENAAGEKKLQSAITVKSADNPQSLQSNSLNAGSVIQRPALVTGVSCGKAAAPFPPPVQAVDQEDEEELSGTKMDSSPSNNGKKDQRPEMTAPLFGINPVQETTSGHRPVSFSSPPTFHSISPQSSTKSKAPPVLRHPESCADEESNSENADKQGGSGISGPAKKHVTFAETIQEIPISPVKNSDKIIRLPPTLVSLLPSATESSDDGASPEEKSADTPMSPSNDEDGVGIGSDGKARNPTLTTEKELLQVITDNQTPGGQRVVEVTNVNISVKHFNSPKRIKCPLSTIRFTFKEGDDASVEFVDTDTGTTGIWESLSPSSNYKGVRKIKKPEYALIVVVGSIGVDETKRYYLRCQQRSYETIFRLLQDLTPKPDESTRLLLANSVGSLSKSSDTNDMPAHTLASAEGVLSGEATHVPRSISGIHNASGSKSDNIKVAGLKRQVSKLGDTGDNTKADKKARVDQGSKLREEKKRPYTDLLINKRKELLAQIKPKDRPASTGSAKSDGGQAKVGSNTVPSSEAGPSSSPHGSNELTATQGKSSITNNSTRGDEKRMIRREDSARSLASRREGSKNVGLHLKSLIGSGASGRKSDGGKLSRQSTGGRNVRHGTRSNIRISASPSSLQPQKSIFKAVKMRPPPDNGADILLESRSAEREAMLSEDLKELEKRLSEQRKANEGRMMKETSLEVARAVEAERNRQRAKLGASFQLALDKVLSPWKKQTSIEDERKKHAAGCLSKARPGSLEDFFARLHTFRPSTWPEFDAQSPIGPVECALRGWHNEAVGRLASSEGSKIDADFNELYDSKFRVEKLKSLRSAIEGSGHALLSVWTGQKCPESFRTVEGSRRKMEAEELRNIADEMRSKNAGSLIRCGRECKDDTWTVPGLQEDECLKLACCNWRLDGAGTVDLWCNWCNRRFPIIPKCIFTEDADPVALPPFHPQRSHFNFCPFWSSTGPVVHVRSLGVAVPEAILKDSEGTL